LPDAFAISTISADCSDVIASGFSQTTFLPAARMAFTCS
jgi:hypothetical protein